MRLIAVLGVLFVLASCSDSNIHKNFSLMCYSYHTASFGILGKPETTIETEVRDSTVFIFDLEKNIVKVTKVKIPYLEELVWYELHIFHKFEPFVYFAYFDDYGGSIYFLFDRAELTIKEYDTQHDWQVEYQCKLPQV